MYVTVVNEYEHALACTKIYNCRSEDGIYSQYDYDIYTLTTV